MPFPSVLRTARRLRCALAVEQSLSWLRPARPLLGIALGLAAGFAVAQPIPVSSTETGIVGTAERMISFRSQEHMWQTADGATHVLINRGPAVGGSLVMFSSFDGGQSWQGPGLAIPSTGEPSTSDGFLDGDDLKLTYSTTLGGVRHATLRYDAGAGTWSLLDSESVFESADHRTAAPALAADGLGRLWLSFTQQEVATSNYSIRLFYKTPSSTTWADSGFVFGPVDNLTNERCSRPVATDKGIGLVYSVRQETFWAERNNFWPLTAAWLGSRIDKRTKPLPDPFGCHFSVIADAQRNLHLFSTDAGAVVYSRRRVGEGSWTTRPITPRAQTAYIQATVADGNLVLVANSYSHAAVWQSTDGGTSFVKTHSLLHPAPVDGVSYEYPRLETPGRSSNPIPVLQQYFEGATQSLLFFPAPVIPAPPARR